MKKHHNGFRWLAGIGISALFLWGGNTHAQQPQTVTGIGTFSNISGLSDSVITKGSITAKNLGLAAIPLVEMTFLHSDESPVEVIARGSDDERTQGDHIMSGDPPVSVWVVDYFTAQYTLKFWNIGAQGGEDYQEAEFTSILTWTKCTSDDGKGWVMHDGCPPHNTRPEPPITLNFSGGPTGVFTFQDGRTWGQLQQDNQGNYFVIGPPEYEWCSLIVENPEAFTTEGIVAGTACTPSAHGLSPSKPGDVISPGASYTDASGNAVGIIQERWFLNGVNTTSIVWDGKQVQVELQYTCLDHVGYSRSYTIPAYQAIPLPPSGLPGGLGTAAGIGAIIAGVAGGLGVAGIAIGQVIKGLKPPVQQPPVPTPPGEGAPPVEPPPVPPAEGAPPVEPPPAPVPPIEGAPPVEPPPAPAPPGEVTPPVQPPPAPAPPAEGAPPVEPPPTPAPPIEGTPPVQPPETPEPGEQPQPPKKEMTPEEKADLINRRSQMQEEVDNLRDKIKQTHGAVEKLTRLKKNNLIKFIFKKAIDLADWIMGSKVEVINKVTIDPTMKILIGEHDKSQDAEIIVNVHNRIQSLNAEIDDFRKQIKYLLDEINKTNQTLAGGGE